LSVFIRQNGTVCKFQSSDSWVILSPIEQRIKAKIEAIGTPLKDWDIKINYGIKTGYNDAFIIDGKKKDELIAQDPKSAEIIRPILRGRDIKRYGYEFADLWLINTHNGIKEKGIKPINIKDYPAIKEHLDKFLPQLQKRADKGDTPYNLRNCAYMGDFYKQKIVWKAVGRNLTFSLLDEGYFLSAPACLFTSDKVNLHYLLAVLCSSYAKYFIYNNSDTTGAGDIMLNIQSLEKLPVPKPNKEIEKKIVFLLNNIHHINAAENEIDKLIYQMLDLQKDEITFISSSVS
jgi:hypothetical protein